MTASEMNLLFMHINTFAGLLKSKGYDGDFYCSHGFVDQVKDSLIKRVLASFLENNQLDRIEMVTDTERNENENTFIRCWFDIYFRLKKGFIVVEIIVQIKDTSGTITEHRMSIHANTHIPEEKVLNQMVREKSQRSLNNS